MNTCIELQGWTEEETANLEGQRKWEKHQRKCRRLRDMHRYVMRREEEQY